MTGDEGYEEDVDALGEDDDEVSPEHAASHKATQGFTVGKLPGKSVSPVEVICLYCKEEYSWRAMHDEQFSAAAVCSHFSFEPVAVTPSRPLHIGRSSSQGQRTLHKSLLVCDPIKN
ncbi:hypothetical protein M404DRAFT_34799 [Pisolithus tinctorius Marx 270]|uniref:Uncharacterized protein n=1 Tax=Pisolithus tinctorius Marx 270 TaxID=870435 RepID=A0A0C3IC98_PISTI|nr:hypothetical protein M404DRAFT_34799 [Pisolithus tinctorius Marx 270]